MFDAETAADPTSDNVSYSPSLNGNITSGNAKNKKRRGLAVEDSRSLIPGWISDKLITEVERGLFCPLYDGIDCPRTSASFIASKVTVIYR